MGEVLQKVKAAALVTGAALFVVACGGAKPAEEAAAPTDTAAVEATPTDAAPVDAAPKADTESKPE